MKIDHKNIIISLAGLPSSGKSSMVNALAGLRILQSGITRTTVNPVMIGKPVDFMKSIEVALTSSDGIPFSIIDLPGVSDSENVGGSFDEMTAKNIVLSDVMIWVTPIETAFLTNHEKENFEKLINVLHNHTMETGKLHQIAIVVTKCNENYHDVRKCKNVEITLNERAEILDDEDSTLFDCIDRVKKLYDHVILFNAFGRILLHGTDALKKIVTGIHSANNIDFNINWVLEKVDEKECEACFISFMNQFAKLFNLMNKNTPMVSMSGTNVHKFNGEINEILQIVYKMSDMLDMLNSNHISKIIELLLTDKFTNFGEIMKNEFSLIVKFNHATSNYYNDSGYYGKNHADAFRTYMLEISKFLNIAELNSSVADFSKVLKTFDIVDIRWVTAYHCIGETAAYKREFYAIYRDIIYSGLINAGKTTFALVRNSNVFTDEDSINENPMIITSLDFIEKVRAERFDIYGENINIELLLMLYVNGKITHLYGPLPGK